MRRKPLLCAVVTLGLASGLATIPGSVARAEPPQLVQYQGRLVDSNGVPLEGTVASLTFRLYSTAAPTSATYVYGERQSNIPVRRGVFTVYLGSGQQIDSSNNPVGAPEQLGQKFDGAERYIQVQVDSDAPLSPVDRIGSVPYALTAGTAPGVVPVGSIIDWFRPDTSMSPPDGWKICDGTAVTDPASPFNGLAVPDLRGRFVRGLVDLNSSYGAGSPLPETGGADSHVLTHQHGISSLPAHTHAITSDGSHGHPANLGDAQGHITTNPIQGHGSGAFYVINEIGPGPNCTHNLPVNVGSAGAHNHGGATGGAIAQGAGSTDFASPGFDNKPPFVGLLKIIRIK